MAYGPSVQRLAASGIRRRTEISTALRTTGPNPGSDLLPLGHEVRALPPVVRLSLSRIPKETRIDSALNSSKPFAPGLTERAPKTVVHHDFAARKGC
jgi:hypothetical protein